MISSRTVAERAVLAPCAGLLTAAVVAFTLREAASGQRVAAAVINGLVVGMPMAVALVTLSSDHRRRFGRMLCAAGAVFALTSLSQAHESLPYSVGRLSVWFVVPLLLLLMLSFPSGRLTEVADRRLMAVTVAIAVTLYLPTALLAGGFPRPSPWTSCGTRCPANAFAVSDLPLGFIRPLREVLLVGVVAAVAWSLARRARGAGPLQRRVIAPVVGIAIFQVVVFAAYQWARRGGAVSPEFTALGRIYLLSLPGVALAFAAGLLLRRLHVATVLQRLALDLRAPATAAAVRARLAEALEDPTLRIAYRRAGEWVDESGAATAIAAAPPERMVTTVDVDGAPAAAVVHDGRLGQDQSLIEAAATYGLVVAENTRLIDDLRASRGELSQVRDRVATIAEGERRRLERDLHDGAQQQLLALRIRLSLAAEDLRADAPDRVRELDAIGDGIDEAVDVVRSLAHGALPMPLAQHGLAAALRLVALDATLPASVRARGVRRYDDAVEAAVYFSCIEALQNAVKHAHGASHVTIELVDDGALRFEVADDGPGFVAGGAAGDGLRNLGDRMASVHGTLTIASRPGGGTRVAGAVPVGPGGTHHRDPTGAHDCGAPTAER
jgi:signal transduction histidine kinase